MPTQKKEVDDVLGGEAAWANVDKTRGGCRQHKTAPLVLFSTALAAHILARFLPAANCPKCGNGEAYFMQLQIRSADEPMTTFFKASGRFILTLFSADSSTLPPRTSCGACASRVPGDHARCRCRCAALSHRSSYLCCAGHSVVCAVYKVQEPVARRIRLPGRTNPGVGRRPDLTGRSGAVPPAWAPGGENSQKTADSCRVHQHSGMIRCTHCQPPQEAIL